MNNSNEVILIYELCRLCLVKPGVEVIFENPILVQDIFLCTGVKVIGTDNLPGKICSKCLEVVVNAKQLRELAKATEMYLKSRFDNDKTDQTKSLKENELTTRSKEKIEDDSQAIKEKTNSNEKGTLSSENDKSQTKKIFVRKDLFESSAALTSPTKDNATIEQSSKTKCKRKNTENDCEEYKCEVCQKKFNVWKKYYLHQRSHNRNNKCPVHMCGKRFATKGDLEKHIRTHTGERPYHCEICHRGFSQRGTLKAHRETVHAEVITCEEYII